MANPFRAVRDFLTGEDLKVRTAAAPAGGGPEPEQKTVMYTFTTENYSGEIADGAGPTLSAALGGPRLDLNSAVYACQVCICSSFQEAPLRLFRVQGDGSDEFVDVHPFMELMDDPHPSLSQSEVNFWIEFAKGIHGNAFLRKIRDRAGRVRQLWPVSPMHMWPETDAEDKARGVFVSRYVLDDGTGNREEVPVADVVHFRMGVDDRDHRLGMSPLRRLIREVASDEEATRFASSLLSNYAVPSLAVQLPPGPVLTEEQAQAIRDRLRSEYGGSGRGQIAVVANGATLQTIGFNPQQMDLKGAHEFPESRIAAVFGTPAMVVGLGIGLQRSTFSNYKEAREALFEQTIIPLWRADAATFRKQLLVPDFGADRTLRLKYDLNEVRALQEDQNAIYARLTEAVKAKWLKRNEARAEVGFDPVDGWDAEDEQNAVDAAAAMFEATTPAPAEGEEDEAPASREQRARVREAQRKALGLGAIPGMLDVLHDLAAPALESDLETLFREQHRRVAGRLRGES